MVSVATTATALNTSVVRVSEPPLDFCSSLKSMYGMYLEKFVGKKAYGRSKSIRWQLAGVLGGGWFIK